MPKFDDYKTMARERGSLAMELYVVTSTPVVGPEEMQKHLPDHLAYQAECERNRSLVMAGPLSDESGENIVGVGHIVYRAESVTKAREIADADPMHARGIKTYDLRRWLVNEGSLTLSVGFSTGGVSDV